MSDKISVQVAVLGAGPGGYTAAFLAADAGKTVALIDVTSKPGGTCLYRGCIPSKALLHAANLIDEAHEAASLGVEFNQPNINLDKIRETKNQIVTKLSDGLAQLTKARKIQFVQGRGRFIDEHTIRVLCPDKSEKDVVFENAIVATGSTPTPLPGVALKSPRLIDSTGALSLVRVPKTLLVVGAGYIGLELGSVYASLGSEVTVVELLDGLVPGADRDLTTVLQRQLKKKFKDFLFKTKVIGIVESTDGLTITFEKHDGTKEDREFNAVLVSIGRRPNAKGCGLEEIGVVIDQRGFVAVNEHRQTSVPHVFAIGDITGQPMLAHKAQAEARVAVETLCGKPSVFAPKSIPAVMFTNPEVAWCGVTETEAKQKNLNVKIEKFPWLASGRALTLSRTEGFTKLISDPQTGVLLGAAIIGQTAGDLISECALAVEKGLTFRDLAHTIHPHPTLSETIMEAAELLGGNCVHLSPRRKA